MTVNTIPHFSTKPQNSGRRLYRLYTIVTAVIMLLSSGVTIASDINNPINCYSVTIRDRDTGEQDSVLLGKIYFDPLPEYRVESRVRVEFYPLTSFPDGVVIRVHGPVVGTGGIQKPTDEIHIGGPIEKGETVTAEFTIAPQSVGINQVSFLAYANNPADSMWGAHLHQTVNLHISPDGRTVALASAAADFRRASKLGPNPDLFSKGLTFFSNPKPRAFRLPKDTSGANKQHVEKAVFGILIDATFSPESPNELILNCKVWPFHDFQEGIGIKVRHADAYSISDISSSVVGPVSSDDPTEFSVKASIREPGIHGLQVLFETMNPNFGAPEGAFARVKTQVIAGGVNLYIGVDNSGEIVFITDREPRTGYDVLEKYGVNPTDIDSRYSLVATAPQLSRSNSVTGTGYDQVIQKTRRRPKGLFKRP